MNKRVLVLGATGLLGSNLVHYFNKQKLFQVFTHTHTKQADFKGDLSDHKFVFDMISRSKPDVVINLVALTNVDECERQPQKAYEVNVHPGVVLSNVFRELSLTPDVIYISTDQVYDGRNSEEKDLSLKNIYALTKLWGEREYPRGSTAVLRTNFFGGDTDSRTSFTGWIQNTLKANGEISGFTDVYFSPLHISTLCKMIEVVCLKFTHGVYNLGAKEGMSKYDFIKKYSVLLGFNESVCLKSLMSDSKSLCARPKDMSMNSLNFEEKFNVELPYLKDEIKKEIGMN